jgi:hypothetical protein
MESTIAPEVRANPELRELVERADAEIRQSLRTPAEGRSWSWTMVGPASGPTLTFSYEGNTSSRTFSAADLRHPRTVAAEAHNLWQDVLLANIRRTRDNILSLVREIEVEEPVHGL